MRRERILVWETFDVNDPLTQAAGDLYEKTLAPEERIPWIWIEKAVEGRRRRKRHFHNEWTKHLLLAALESELEYQPRLAGYAYGAYLPGFGGYLCYLGVADWARRLGVGTRLMEQFIRQMAVDAGELGEPLPFVLWESRRPELADPEPAWQLWTARMRLFHRVGGWWIEGVNLLTPNFAADDEGEEDADPVPLQVFLRPVDEPATAFDSERLRQIVARLQQTVYRRGPGDELFDQTLPPGCQPRLRPALNAIPARAVMVTQ
ncbi:MAG: GNAT family N-acetyltransferase [Gemmataceae bacterium]|nr:GNAT family N-acetyltransferase [Gemmataceae bacterium]MCS7272430.1 GNAT family N-acetyltransferase [Gemmataceae bacterium]MDW8243363.1 GNAT family N-acetyltransferase [Thermogemmata sp.]